jgi:hypothetical protein
VLVLAIHSAAERITCRSSLSRSSARSSSMATTRRRHPSTSAWPCCVSTAGTPTVGSTASAAPHKALGSMYAWPGGIMRAPPWSFIHCPIIASRAWLVRAWGAAGCAIAPGYCASLAQSRFAQGGKGWSALKPVCCATKQGKPTYQISPVDSRPGHAPRQIHQRIRQWFHRANEPSPVPCIKSATPPDGLSRVSSSKAPHKAKRNAIRRATVQIIDGEWHRLMRFATVRISAAPAVAFCPTCGTLAESRQSALAKHRDPPPRERTTYHAQPLGRQPRTETSR